MSLRVASLDYLGVVAARLRKDAISSQLDDDTVENILNELNASSEENSLYNSDTQSNSSDKPNTDLTEQLQRAMLHYLQTNTSNDPALKYSGKFYIAQWYRDLSLETERMMKDPKDTDTFDDDGNIIDQANVKLDSAEKRKTFILTLINYNNKKHVTSTILRHGHSTLSYENASLVARYLASTRPFSRSFDIYLQQILRVLSEQAVAVRTKAMKCLTAVVEVDPAILARADMQQGVHGRFRDQSTSVREAAVELVGKFVLVKPELTHQYYNMLSERILDTGISVRKRVVKILRDICLEQPEFPKVVEICVKIIRRVNDEEGIKKLVNEVFQQLWFTPVLKGKNSEELLRKVLNIADVVAACKDCGSEWFEQLLNNLLKTESDSLHKSVKLACEEVVDCLVDNVLSLERNIAEKSFDDEDTTTVNEQQTNTELSPMKTSSQRLLSCITTLFLFSRVRPQLLVPHANTLSPYLTTKCNTQCDYLVLHYVAKILELVVPLMEHPGEAFLASLEEELLKLIFKQGMMVLQSCVSCLASVVNNVTHNFKLVRDCFQRFFSLLNRLKNVHMNNPSAQNLASSRPSLLRALFTVGLFSKHFDFDAERKFANNSSKGCVRDRVFELLFYFTSYPDEEIRLKAITSLGFQCITHADLMLGDKMKTLYQSILADNYIPNSTPEETELSISMCKDKALRTLLRNVQTYLIEEESKMRKADAEWSKHSKEEDLKEMGDVSSGMASSVIQVYLKHLLEVAFHHDGGVRMLTLHVFCLVLRQGLIHPVQCVPYLVAGGTDIDPAVRVKADQQLSEIDTKYPGFIHMKASQGIRMSYRLQQVLFKDSSDPVRGYREDDNITALCYHLYTTIRNNRQHRRALVLPLLKMFDDQSQKADLETLVFVADNIAHFPYLTQDEPLFMIHHCDIVISISGANIITTFKELLFPEWKVADNETGETRKLGDITEELDDDLIDHFPEDSTALLEWLTSSYCCVLLLLLKQHLKDLHGFSDAKCHRYAPCDSVKANDKPVTRKNGIVFNPSKVLDYIKKRNLQNVKNGEMTEEWKEDVIKHFYEFKEMMLKYDPTEEDDEDDETTTGVKPRLKTPSRKSISSENTPSRAKQQQPDTSAPPIDDDQEAETLDDGSSVKKSFMQRMKSKSHKSSKSRHSSKSVKKKHKKKKRKYFAESDSDDDSDSDSDPDFMC